MSTGVAIIGAGMVAHTHVSALREIAGATICGVYSRSLEGTRAFAGEYGLSVYERFEDVLTDPAVTAVIICLPPGNHAEFCIAAAKAKKHVIVEKPMEITVARSRQMIVACRENGVSLSVIFQNRYTPAACRVKQALEAGALGRLLLADAYIKWYRSPAYYQSRNWRGTLAIEGGGALINQAIHTIDLLQWLAGGVRSVSGLVRTTTHAIEAEDLGVAMVEFVNGALGVIEGSTAILPSYKERIELHGEKGSIILEGGNIREWKVAGMEETDYVAAEKASYGVTDSPAISHVNHQAQLTEILAAIAHGRQPLVSGEEGLKALEIITAIYHSSKTRQWVDLR
ncbi:MAG: Gfo/Idh/MocA family oxidoreductase [Sporomusaceae bacterium]|nr:Gfo/Idh/MocA family oxidoreductase [Sporomusaceae bacterium]